MMIFRRSSPQLAETNLTTDHRRLWCLVEYDSYLSEGQPEEAFADVYRTVNRRKIDFVA